MAGEGGLFRRRTSALALGVTVLLHLGMAALLIWRRPAAVQPPAEARVIYLTFVTTASTNPQPSDGPVKQASAKPAALPAKPVPSRSREARKPVAENTAVADDAPATPKVPVQASSDVTGADLSATTPDAAGQGSSLPVPVAQNPPPNYPENARKKGIEGDVLLCVTVTADGQPVEVTVVRSSTHDMLDDEAMRAVRRWRFHPALMRHHPVPGLVVVPIIFQLNN